MNTRCQIRKSSCVTTLGDITCDSDGKVDQFIDLHNLLGDAHTVHVRFLVDRETSRRRRGCGTSGRARLRGVRTPAAVLRRRAESLYLAERRP
jgi:arginine decarboxylase-like protein